MLNLTGSAAGGPNAGHSVTLGNQALATSQNAVAIGTNAAASGGKAVSVGYANTASGNGASAIGDDNTASGQGAVAIGAGNTATGSAALSLGNGSVASGSSTLAMGNNAQATSTGAIAIGSGSVASADNSVAIGNGSVATRADQVSLGSAQSTYTMAGLASSASRAAQSGSTRFVTSDAAGNLAASDFGPDTLFALDSRTTALETNITALLQGQKRADAGTAIALAMGGTLMPPDMNVALSFNMATYNGQQGFSGSVVAKVAPNIWLNVGAAAGTAKGSEGGRAGVTFGW